MSSNKREGIPWAKLGPVIPVPAVYIDEIMPALTDTEWRVLLVVIRQTVGWVERGSKQLRKNRDWLTHSQLRLRTGKRSDAISRAVNSLVSSGLIMVETEQGSLLTTPQERQRTHARLFYRLGIAPQQMRVRKV